MLDHATLIFTIIFTEFFSYTSCVLELITLLELHSKSRGFWFKHSLIIGGISKAAGEGSESVRMRLLLTRLSRLCSSTLRSAHMRGLVPATSPLNSLHEGTGRRDLSHEQFTRSVLRNKSQGLVPKN